MEPAIFEYGPSNATGLQCSSLHIDINVMLKMLSGFHQHSVKGSKGLSFRLGGPVPECLATCPARIWPHKWRGPNEFLISATWERSTNSGAVPLRLHAPRSLGGRAILPQPCWGSGSHGHPQCCWNDAYAPFPRGVGWILSTELREKTQDIQLFHGTYLY